MFLKSLVSSFGAQFFSNRSLNYFLVVGLGIFVIYFLVQVKSNQKEILLSKFRFQPDSNVEKGFYSAAESAYRKKFNLLERPTEVAGEECNLGSSTLILFLSFLFNKLTLLLDLRVR